MATLRKKYFKEIGPAAPKFLTKKFDFLLKPTKRVKVHAPQKVFTITRRPAYFVEPTQLLPQTWPMSIGKFAC